jgi:hypothetical protein
MFADTFRLQLAGYSGGKIIASALILGAISWILLSVGAYPGGALTFVYGVRVLKRPQARVGDALITGHADHSD